LNLFVLRHGKAEQGTPDALRELRPRGREDVKRVVQARQTELAGLTAIHSSPLTRARQTAELAAEILGFKGAVEECAQIAPWSTPEDFLKTLPDAAGDLLIATHQPFCSTLVKHLTGTDLWMPTASLACLNADPMARGCAELVWQQNPAD